MFQFERVTPKDLRAMRELLDVYAVAFDDLHLYRSAPPSDAWLQKILARDTFITLVAKEADRVVGGLSAYVLEKSEQERSEIYIYDLAVLEAFRRRGAARGLITTLQKMAPDFGAWVLFVQADYGDEPAIKLYESLGTREEVMHFDIKVADRKGTVSRPGP